MTQEAVVSSPERTNRAGHFLGHGSHIESEIKPELRLRHTTSCVLLRSETEQEIVLCMKAPAG